MYSRIVVPVDIGHSEKLEKALATSADLAKHYDAELHYIGVTLPGPSSVAHNPMEFADKLKAFAEEQANKRGIEIKTLAVTSVDPVRDLDDAITNSINELDADLVIIASHVPGFAEYIFASNAGYLAENKKISVFVVR